MLVLVALVLTRSHGEHHLVNQYIDDTAEMLVQQFDVRLRFVWNPLSRGFGVFDYKEGAICEVSALEFGYLPTILPLGSYKEETENGYRHISFGEKSLIRGKKISTLKITLGYKYEKPDYRNAIHANFPPGKIQVTNDNPQSVSRYAVRVPKILHKQSLKHDPKLYDMYDEGNETVIIFREIPARVSSISGQETIWI
jgi:hypothetical protein